MSKTNAVPSQATQSVPASNDTPASAASKTAFNYAAAAARSSSSGRPTPAPSNSTSTPPPPSIPSAVVATSNATNLSSKPSTKAPESNQSTTRPVNGLANSKPSAPAPERKASLAAAKAHNIKPCESEEDFHLASSHISFGSLAEIPIKPDASTILSSSPANPPTLSRRDGPPVFGSVSAEPTKKAANPPPSGTSVASKANAPAKAEKKKIDFQSFFMSGGESVSHPPPPPASSGSSPSPSISYRGDPTQTRRNPNNYEHINAISSVPPPSSPRVAHSGVSNGPNSSGSFHSPLSGASRAFTPGQGPSPMPQSQSSHYGPATGHWQGGQGPNSPHYGPSNHHGMGMPNYSHPNSGIVNSHGNQQQFMQKPGYQHRNGTSGQSGGPASPMYPSSNRSGHHHSHSQRGGMAGPSSPRLPSANTSNGAPSAGYQHPSTGPGIPAPYWSQGPYPPSGPGPYPGYGFNPSALPYPHPGNFPPPPPHGQHSSPQLSNQPGPPATSHNAPASSASNAQLPNNQRAHPTPSAPSPIPSSPVLSNASYAPPYPPSALYSPGASHSRGPSLSYNAPTFNPIVVSPDFKPHTPNVAAPAFQPRRSAAVAIKKPVPNPVSNLSEEGDKYDESIQQAQGSKDQSGTLINSAPEAEQHSESSTSVEDSPSLEKLEAERKEKAADEKRAADEAAEKQRKEQENRTKEEAEIEQKAQEKERLEREAKEKIEKEAKEKMKQEAQQKAEREAKEKAEREAVEKAEREARELAERENQKRAEELIKEKIDTASQSKKEQGTGSVLSQASRGCESQAKTEPKAAPSASQIDSTHQRQPSESIQSQSSVKSLGPIHSSKPQASPLSTLPESTSLPGLPSKPVNGACLPPSNSKNRPSPIDVNAVSQHKRGSSISSDLPSALSSARKIEDLGQVSYPSNIQSPRLDLNTDAIPGKFRYDREFLLQFMGLCKDKPAQLPDLDSIGMVDSISSAVSPLSRPQSTGGQRRSTAQLPLSNRDSSTMLTPSGPGMSMMGPASMPNRAGHGAGVPMFATGTDRSSDDRFQQSNRPALGAMPIGSGLMLPGRPTGQLSRTPSNNAMPSMMANGARDPSRRSGRSSARDGHGAGTLTPPNAQHSNMNRGGTPLPPIYPVELVKPLQPSANSWAASRYNQLDEDSPQMVNRKVKALLNKLTLDNFESISDQVISWANKSEKEHDGRILRQVIALIFEKATDEAHWSEMYAKLCRKLMEKLSPDVKDENVLDSNGNKVHGGHLFRKYLLNRCQEDYEKGWSRRDELAAAAAGKAADDAVKQAANEKSRAEAEALGKDVPIKEAEILSDEYYAAQKAKRQGLGLVRFIGELFKLYMLTERIMHECVKKLLSNIETPEEDDIESLCRFMMTVGELLDHDKAVNHMNVYFTRMSSLVTNPSLSSRARFMLQDVMDCRQNGWVGRNVAAGPKLISQIHQEAAQAAEQSRQAQVNKNMKMNDASRTSSRTGRLRDQMGGSSGDGWLSVGGNVPPPRPSKAGDLTQFGKLRDTPSGRPSFGPSNVFANKGKLKDGKAQTDREPAVAVASNPFAALGGDAGEGNHPGLFRKASTPEMAPAGRPRLNLAPRTLPLPGQVDSDNTEKAKSSVETSDAKEEEVDISDEMANRLIKNRVDEFLNVKSVNEAAESFSSLPKSRYYQLIRALVEKVIDRKPVDVDVTAALFRKLSEDTVSKPAFLKAFEPVVEQLEDLVVDARYAYEYCAKLLKASQIGEADIKQLALKIDTENLESATKRLLDSFSAAKVD
ncbi:hypothetical protein PPACK8108_LOCUS23679 [Phakopsora pachyrhizi]|uniref:MI domain-containing protein n=1 Tax=Phakopsora pachyrhizi TaxID=170000 RepID=A0AAV0BSZ4_PHAPC|nr:hypothetical protein PPACK8108_LOCUS23679 [Phakopsora pachyrhizi]